MSDIAPYEANDINYSFNFDLNCFESFNNDIDLNEDNPPIIKINLAYPDVKEDNIKNKEINKDKNTDSNLKTSKTSKSWFKTKQIKNILGRKRKTSQRKGNHNKYAKDNIFRKIKNKMIKNLTNHINELINKKYNGNIGYGPNIKKIFTMNQNQIIFSKYDKEFLQTPLKEILSNNISGKYYNFSLEHNKNIIESLLNEEDTEKRDFFKKFFNLKFIDCFKHFKGEKILPILEGLKSLDEVCKDIMKNDKDETYIKTFRYYVVHFEENILNKRNNKKAVKYADNLE